MSRHVQEGLTGGSGPGPDDVAVTEWLETLARQTSSRDWGPSASPVSPSSIGPIDLSPASTADVEEGSPLANAYFTEVLRATKRGTPRVPAKFRELYTLLTRNLDRYLTFTRLKLAQLYQALKPKDRSTFSAIPFLLHTNIPGLPGYLPSKAPTPPYGICAFELNETIRDAVNEILAGAARRVSTQLVRPAIDSLLIMGSVGTIGQGGRSDVDYWVVIDESRYSIEERELLQRKVDVVESWATRRGLEVHFFIVDTTRARRNDFGGAVTDADSCGTAQGKLLKEEFYRTAIYLQGQVPLWWIVPLGIDAREYTWLERILHRVPLSPAVGAVDLGFLGEIDRGEFFGAALWQINKSLKSPFKSLLKMALLARYMSNDRIAHLCNVLKERVLEGENAPQFTDPYVLLFDAISEHFAEQQDWEAFRLVQKCFYLKIGLKLSRETSDRARSVLRFRMMRAYIARWGWDEELLHELDSLESWSADRIDELGQEIRAFMMRVYQFCVTRARLATVKINQEDVTILGRRLFACFADEPGKIKHLFTYFLKEPRVEERLVILEVPEASSARRWEVHRKLTRGGLAGRDEPMWSGSGLPEAAAWVSFNGLFAPNTVVSLHATQHHATANDFRAMLNRFDGLFSCPDPFTIAPAVFLDPRRLVRVAVALNYGVPEPSHHDQGQSSVYRVSENWDVLNHGPTRKSLVQEITLVTLNTWGEMFCARMSGPFALPKALRSLVTRFDRGTSLSQSIDILAPAGRWLQALRNRIGRVFEQLSLTFSEDLVEYHVRSYVYELGGRFQTFRRTKEAFDVLEVRTVRGVVRRLGHIGPGRQQISVDPLSPSLAGMRALTQKRQNDREALVYMGWSRGARQGRVFVHDEQGRVHMTLVAADQCEKMLLRTARRVIYHLRTRVRDAQALRRQIRVFEIRLGQSLGEPVQLRDDIGRVLGLLAAPTAGTKLYLKGDLRDGRQGIYFKWGSDVYSPRKLGRAFADHLVRRILQDHLIYDVDAFAISGSDVRFDGDLYGAGEEPSAVRHLRLIDIYERQISFALARFQGTSSRTTPSRAPFNRTKRPALVDGTGASG